MVTVVGVDPGTTKTAVVLYDGTRIVNHRTDTNEVILRWIELLAEQPRARAEAGHPLELSIEKVASFGMPVGEEVFETVFWSGRFAQAWGRPCHRIRRIDVKSHLCHNLRANDAHVRQALIDRFGPGREVAIGSKKAPGPLYEIHADEWAALAVAVTTHDSLCNEAKG